MASSGGGGGLITSDGHIIDGSFHIVAQKVDAPVMNVVGMGMAGTTLI